MLNNRKQYIEKWKTDYDFKTIVNSLGSLAVTMVFALYNGFLGLYHTTLWYGAICIYYIILVLLRGFIVLSERKIPSCDDPEMRRTNVYFIASLLLLLLNISLVVPVSLMVRLQKPVNLTLIPAIAMAAYTTYKVILSSVNFRKKNNSSDNLVKLLRTINFIDALVSILALQNTLIMVQAAGEENKLLSLTAISSAVIMLAVLALSAVTLRKGIQGFRSRKQNQ